MIRVANLGMYDPSWLQAANDALWRAVAERLRSAGWPGVPDALDRSRPLGAIWRDPGLMLGQTCGYPLVTELKDAVRLVGTPAYDLPGCDGAWHGSVLVVSQASTVSRLEELRGRRAALNGADSNTGMNLLRHAVAPFARDGRFFGAIVPTGGHLASMDSVRQGAADVASIDCVTFELARRHRPELISGLRILQRTARSPALPFVTSVRTPPEDVAILRDALNSALLEAAPGSPIAETGLARVEPSTPADYAILLRYRTEAADAGYPDLL